jgi:hypothetical protein
MRASGKPIALEMANMFEFYSDASDYFTGVRDLDLVREFNPELQTLDSWLIRHNTEIRSTEFRIPPTDSDTIRAAYRATRIKRAK